jgi:hypothetical protein
VPTNQKVSGVSSALLKRPASSSRWISSENKRFVFQKLQVDAKPCQITQPAPESLTQQLSKRESGDILMPCLRYQEGTDRAR